MSVNLDDLRNARNDLLHHIHTGRTQIPADVRDQLDRAVIAIFESAEQARLYPDDHGYRPTPADSLRRGRGRVAGVTAAVAKAGTTITRTDYLERTGS